MEKFKSTADGDRLFENYRWLDKLYAATIHRNNAMAKEKRKKTTNARRAGAEEKQPDAPDADGTTADSDTDMDMQVELNDLNDVVFTNPLPEPSGADVDTIPGPSAEEMDNDTKTPSGKHGPRHYHLEFLKQRVAFHRQRPSVVFDFKTGIFHNEHGEALANYFTDKKCEFLVRKQTDNMKGHRADDTLAMLRASIPQNLCPFVQEEVNSFLGFEKHSHIKSWPDRAGDVKKIVDAVFEHQLLDTLESRTAIYPGSPMTEIDHKKELRWFFDVILLYHDLETMEAFDRGPRAQERRLNAVTAPSRLVVTPPVSRSKKKSGTEEEQHRAQPKPRPPKKNPTKLGLLDSL